MEYFDQVQRAYDELVATGDIHNVAPGTSQEQEIDEQKAYVTRRSAYYVNLKDSNYGLLSKTTGSNVQGLSTDILLKKNNGEYYDIATDVEVGGGYRAIRIINGGASYDTSLIPRWVQPTKEMAGLNGSPEPPIPPTPNPSTIDEKLDLIIALLKKYHEEEMTAIQKPRTLV